MWKIQLESRKLNNLYEEFRLKLHENCHYGFIALLFSSKITPSRSHVVYYPIKDKLKKCIHGNSDTNVQFLNFFLWKLKLLVKKLCEAMTSLHQIVF